MMAFQDMTWFGWVIIVWWSLNGLAYVALVDRVQKFTKGGAVTAVVMYSIMNLLLLTVGANH